MNGQAPAPGETIGGYRLDREIGRGAMGVVFAAQDAGGQVVALKVLVPPPLLPDPERASLRGRFLREARALRAVNHPNVVRVDDFGEADGRLYLAMELLEGENLRQLLTRTGALSPDEAVRLTLQLCAALDAVHHAGIVHRDVKPENVVVLPGLALKLTDFGVAWMENEATLTRTGGILGSPAYMSPEQILGRPVDRRSDVFSAAVTLYQLLADRLPFAGSGLMEVAHNVAYGEPAPLPPSVPHALARIVMRGLQKTPAARYATAGEFAQALAPSAAPLAATSLAATPLAPAALLDPENLEATRVDTTLRCARHPRQMAVGHCQACGRRLCGRCVHGQKAPYYCRVHLPVTVLGFSPVRVEVFLALVAFLLLLLCLSPLGYGLLVQPP